MRLVNSNRIF